MHAITGLIHIKNRAPPFKIGDETYINGDKHAVMIEFELSSIRF